MEVDRCDLMWTCGLTPDGELQITHEITGPRMPPRAVPSSLGGLPESNRPRSPPRKPSTSTKPSKSSKYFVGPNCRSSVRLRLFGELCSKSC